MIGEPILPTRAPRPYRLTAKLAPRTTAGAGGGLVASVATCPLDVIKTKLQAQRAVHGHRSYLGVVGEGFTIRGARALSV